MPVGLLLGPVPEGRIAPESPDVVQELDLGLEAAEGFRVPEVARDCNVVSPKTASALEMLEFRRSVVNVLST